jgi:hypothetical protein
MVTWKLNANVVGAIKRVSQMRPNWTNNQVHAKLSLAANRFH